ncbi:type II secretion system F family protein, partial [Methanoculleus sp. UBA312]
MLPAGAHLRRFVRRRVERDPVRYRSLHEDLVAVNMGVTLDRYLLRAYLVSVLFGVLWAVLAFLAMRLAVFPRVSVGVYNVFAIRLPGFELTDTWIDLLQVAASAVIFVLTAYAAYIFFLYYPSILKKSRATRINLLLHNVVSYMYAMRQGGTEMMEVFRAISANPAVYGEAAHEFRRVVRDADYFGCDQITALRHLQETTPSEKLREFVEDLISVVESGGDILAFLDVRVRIYQEDARFEQKTFLSTLQMAAEVYVTLFVAGPLFIIIVMVVLGFISSTPLMELSIVIYLLVPLGSLLFLL